MKNYPCDESKEWYDWEAQRWDEYKLRADRDELRWQDHERRRMKNSDRDCGFVEDEYETETDF